MRRIQASTSTRRIPRATRRSPWPRLLPLAAALTAMSCSEPPPPHTGHDADPTETAAPQATTRTAPQPAAPRKPKLPPLYSRAEELPKAVQDKLNALDMTLQLPKDFALEAFGEHSRFDFRAWPPQRNIEMRYSLGPGKGDTHISGSMLARVVYVAVHNFAKDNNVCDPVEEPLIIAWALGADRVIRVCFQPADYMGKDFRSAIAYGLFKRGHGLVFTVALFNDADAAADVIGPGTFSLKFRKPSDDVSP